MAQIIGDWREPGGTPILPLQHVGYDKDRGTNGPWDLQLRSMITACRVEGRDDESGGLGEWIYERGTVGDVLGGFFWERSSRAISGWAFAWPSITVASMSGTASGVGNVADPEMLPTVWDGEQRAKPDQRWGQLQYEIPLVQGRQQRRYSKFPIGTHAVALTATNENEQKNLLWHTDPRTVAANVAGDGLMGTYLCDLNSRGEYSPDHYARYQTAWRVVRPRVTCGPCPGVVSDPERQGRFLNTIAWNLALTGLERAFGRGMVIDNAWGGGGTPTSGGGSMPVEFL